MHLNANVDLIKQLVFEDKPQYSNSSVCDMYSKDDGCWLVGFCYAVTFYNTWL